MSIFESLNQTSDKALDVGETYYKKTQEYYKLKVFQQLSTTIGMFCKIVVIGSFLFLSMVLIAVAGTIALGHILNNMIFACLIIALLLLVLGTLFYIYRTKIDTVIIKKIAKQFFD